MTSRPDTVDTVAPASSADPAARDELFDLLNGYWRTQMLCTAAELGLADALAEGPCDIATLARRTGADADALARLLRALAGFGVVARTVDGRYATTGRGRWLERSRTGGLHARALLIRRLWYPSWAGLPHSVRTGETALDHTFGASLFDHLATDLDTAAVFDQTMAESTTIAAAEVADSYDSGWARTVVDLGGGTGALLTELLARHPHARGILVETPAVAERARAALLDRDGVATRCEVREGDFFADVPGGADLYLLSWVLHDWPDPHAVQILANCRRAMSTTARLLVVEVDDRTFVVFMQQTITTMTNGPIFLGTLMGGFVFTGVAAILQYRRGARSAAGWTLAAALALYVAAMAITAVVHFPLNDTLVQAGDPDTIADLASLRADTEGIWVTGHVLRTVVLESNTCSSVTNCLW